MYSDANLFLITALVWFYKRISVDRSREWWQKYSDLSPWLHNFSGEYRINWSESIGGALGPLH